MTQNERYGRCFDLRHEHVSLDDSGAEAVEITSQFWPDVLSGRRRLSCWLLGANHRAEDTESWDLHPRGECIVVLLTGAIDIVLQESTVDDRVVELREPGASVVIPRGIWHRQIVHAPSDLLFLTAGEGTEQRPVD